MKSVSTAAAVGLLVTAVCAAVVSAPGDTPSNDAGDVPPMTNCAPPSGTTAAAATNMAGTAYGGEETFTTIAVHTVTFVPGAHSVLGGTLSQTIERGGDCTAVTAAADGGYHFVSWTSTGGFSSVDNPLTITNVTADMTITANFAIDTLVWILRSGAAAAIRVCSSYASAPGWVSEPRRWNEVSHNRQQMPNGSGSGHEARIA